MNLTWQTCNEWLEVLKSIFGNVLKMLLQNILQCILLNLLLTRVRKFLFHMRPFSFIFNTQATPTTHWKSQFVLTLLLYYFSFFQANFAVLLSLPICRVLNPGKVHVLYITFTKMYCTLNLTNKLLVSIKIKETFNSNPF